MDTDNSVVKAWGGAGTGWRGVNGGGKWGRGWGGGIVNNKK